MEENEPTARDEKEAEPELEKDESPFDETEEPLVVRPGLPPMDEIFADLDLDPDELAQLNNMNDMNDMDESLDDFDDFDDFDVIRAGDERTRAMDDELFEDLDDDDIDIDGGHGGVPEGDGYARVTPVDDHSQAGRPAERDCAVGHGWRRGRFPRLPLR